MAGPGIGQPITAANLANWIPIVWAQEVIADVENSLVLAALFDRSYEKYTRFGDTIVIPRLAEISAHVVNTEQQATTYYVEQNAENISLDQKFDIAVVVDDINQVQTNPKYFDKVRSKMAYGLAKIIDTNCANMLRGFNSGTKLGTTGSALTEDILIECYEKLNEGNAPFSDRAWTFDPASITDLVKNDYFIRMDYVPGSVVAQGFQGRQIFGSPVYISTDLFAYGSTSEHVSGYFHREAAALAVQMNPRFEVARLPLQHADVIIGLGVWGLKEIRTTFGVPINCRS